jgi:hypothetical protein
MPLFFMLASTFGPSLIRLSNQDQQAVKTTVFDLQMDPTRPGLSYHKLDHARDPRFASVRVSRDLRLIVHRTDNSLMICYAGHHDEAYAWARRRKLETHPRTGAAQMVEIVETRREVEVPVYLQAPDAAPRLAPLDGVSADDLLGYGVPQEWLEAVRVADEDTLLALADHLPDEAAEAVLELAAGGTPQAVQVAGATVDPFEHPDAQRRFRVLANREELEQALNYPWEKWLVYLHPSQRGVASADYNGPARVSGSAGTGKTVVALHRAAHLARENPGSRILLTTFSSTLARALQEKLRLLLHPEPHLADQIEVQALDYVGERLYRAVFVPPKLASDEQIAAFLAEAACDAGEVRATPRFLQSEWSQVVDAWQLRTWEEYRDVPRLGRKTRLAEDRRRELWSVFEQVLARLSSQGLITKARLFGRLAAHYATSGRPPYDYVVVDEAQDVSVAQLRFLAAHGANRPNCLFFAGDLGQRIFQQPFSWLALGIEIRGRSRTLRINYRTSHQIRRQADRLLALDISDVDGNKERRDDTVSVFNGPQPGVFKADTPETELTKVADWLKARVEDGVEADEIGVFVRTDAQLGRARAAVEAAGLPYGVLDGNTSAGEGQASVCTMHLAKGLEFRAVVVMACDDEVIPLQERIETASEMSDLEEVYNTERHLLYVACTRARDYLLVSGVSPVSEFLDDMGMDDELWGCGSS